MKGYQPKKTVLDMKLFLSYSVCAVLALHTALHYQCHWLVTRKNGDTSFLCQFFASVTIPRSWPGWLDVCALNIDNKNEIEKTSLFLFCSLFFLSIFWSFLFHNCRRQSYADSYDTSMLSYGQLYFIYIWTQNLIFILSTVVIFCSCILFWGLK